MPWVAIDDAVMDHPKIRALTDPEFRAWIGALAYAQRYDTQGHIPAQSLPAIHKANEKVAEKLVQVGLWHRNGDGWEIHDFAKFNPDRRRKNDRQQRWRDGKRDDDET